MRSSVEARDGTVLVLAPHTDDGEFGCGGALARFASEGRKVVYVAFSAAEKSVPEEFPRDILRDEVRAATKVLGIHPEELVILDYEVRTFPQHRQEILEQLIELRSAYDPALVFLPASTDIHQDHGTIAAEGLRAFKQTTILGYEMPWNTLTFTTTAFVILDNAHIEKKVEALECYESQMTRPYGNREFVESLARVRGTAIGVTYAEAFEVVRWML